MSKALNFVPARMLEVELAEPLPDVSAFDAKADRVYCRALSLVRLHTQPLGVVAFDFDINGLNAAEYGRRIWQALSAEIAEHLRDDGLPPVTGIEAAGLQRVSTPRCLHYRAALLADPPFASVVIATRDRLEKLSRCLDTLLNLDYPNYEIIVVDNAPSTTATADWIKQTFDDSRLVHYVREDHPGNSRARNRGLLEARGSIVAFVDDDVLVDKRWLTEIVKNFVADEQVACVTGLILPVEVETQSQAWIEQYGGFGKGFKRRVFDMAKNRPANALYPYTSGIFGSGASMAFKVSVLRRIGGFDPTIGGGSPALGGEDLAVFFQVVTRGYRLVYEPAAIVRHHDRRDYAGLRRQVYGYGVGLAAYLTKCLFDDPRRLGDFVTKIPRGLWYVLNPRSLKNEKRRPDYPGELTHLEIKGMLYGPLAYLRGRRRAHQLRKQYGPLDVTDNTSGARQT